jgi:hypothetical protein
MFASFLITQEETVSVARPSMPTLGKVVLLLLSICVCNRVMSAQESHFVSASPPKAADVNFAAPRFWKPSTIALVALDAAAKSADAYATRRNIDGGGAEYNPMARPFVHTTSIQVASMAALIASEISAAYWLHHRHRENRSRAILLGGAVMNGLGAACSFKYRVGDW